MPTSSAATSTDKYYIAQIHGLRTYSLSTLYVDYQHLSSLSSPTLAEAIVGGYYRFLPFLTKALHDSIAKYEPRYFKQHRQPGDSATQGSSTESNDATDADSQGDKTINQQTDKLFTLACFPSRAPPLGPPRFDPSCLSPLSAVRIVEPSSRMWSKPSNTQNQHNVPT
jgi:DNA replication licensing factor MCM6